MRGVQWLGAAALRKLAGMAGVARPSMIACYAVLCDVLRCHTHAAAPLSLVYHIASSDRAHVARIAPLLAFSVGP